VSTLVSSLPTVARAIVALIVFTIGLDAASRRGAALWRRPGLLARSLVAVLVAVPLLTAVLVREVALPPAVGAGLLLVVVAVGPVLAVKRLKGVPADLDFAIGFSVVLLVIGVIWVPVVAKVFAAIFQPAVDVPVAIAAEVLLPTQLLPLVLGIALGHLAPTFATRVERPLRRVTNAVFLACVVAIAVALARPALSLGGRAYVCIAALAIGATAIGHLLGGPRIETRVVLAGFSGARFPMLAFALAEFTTQGARTVAPTVLVYVIFNALALVVYAGLLRLRPGHPPVAAAPSAG
jgi:BASS family bile acid:Na+ symporter